MLHALEGDNQGHTEARGGAGGADSDFAFIFHFSVFIFYVSVFVFYFSVFVLKVLIFNSSFSFSVLVLVSCFAGG